MLACSKPINWAGVGGRNRVGGVGRGEGAGREVARRFSGSVGGGCVLDGAPQHAKSTCRRLASHYQSTSSSLALA